MGIFRSQSAKIDINQVVADREPDSVLLDVREEREYARGRIPGSINIPATRISFVMDMVPRKDTKIYVYCLSGARSGRAVMSMRRFGYTNVKDIGGINKYKGPIEK